MDLKRRRTLSSGSSRSCESMSVASSGDSSVNNDGQITVNLVTNGSFFQDANNYVNYTDVPSEFATIAVSPLSLPDGTSTRVPSNMSSDYELESPSPLNFEIAKIISILRIKSNYENIERNHWYSRLCNLLGKNLKRMDKNRLDLWLQRLKKHLKQGANGRLSVTLVAASLLQLHPDAFEVRLKNWEVDVPKILPSPIREMLSQGKMVPLRHIIYAEAIYEGSLQHNISGVPVKANPYPIKLENEPPTDFVEKIGRPDLFRGVTTHSLTVGARFPKVGAKMHTLARDLWFLLYTEGIDVQVALDVYDEYFKEFERQLSMLKMTTINGLPHELIESVKAKYRYRNSTE